MQNKVAMSTTSGIAKAKSDTKQARIDLRRRPRITESLIQGFLFLCGAISILTTIGIVYELSKESLSFFTRQLWEDTNKQLAVDASAQATVLSVTKGGKALRPEQVLRVGDEVMHILAIDGETLTVERGLQGTQAVSHSAGNDLFLSNRVSLIEFFTKTIDKDVGHGKIEDENAQGPHHLGPEVDVPFRPGYCGHPVDYGLKNIQLALAFFDHVILPQ